MDSIDNLLPWTHSYWPDLRTRLVSLTFATAISLLYPISVHLWPGSNSLPRDNPTRIKRNIISIGFVMLIASFAIVNYHSSNEFKSMHWTLYDILTRKHYPNLALWTWNCVVLPLLMVAALFLGPLALELNDRGGGRTLSAMLSDVYVWRNYIVAPVTEEYLFRGIVLSTLLTSWSQISAVFISSCIFGLMHTHYFLYKLIFNPNPRDKAEVSCVIFQCFYTSIFAFYNAYVYLVSGNLISPILVHTFCNLVGFCLQLTCSLTNLLFPFV